MGRNFLPEGRPEPPVGEEVGECGTSCSRSSSGPVGLSLVQGRDFRSSDDGEAPPVRIVSRSSRGGCSAPRT